MFTARYGLNMFVIPVKALIIWKTSRHGRVYRAQNLFRFDLQLLSAKKKMRFPIFKELRSTFAEEGVCVCVCVCVCLRVKCPLCLSTFIKILTCR